MGEVKIYLTPTMNGAKVALVGLLLFFAMYEGPAVRDSLNKNCKESLFRLFFSGIGIMGSKCDGKVIAYQSGWKFMGSHPYLMLFCGILPLFILGARAFYARKGVEAKRNPNSEMGDAEAETEAEDIDDVDASGKRRKVIKKRSKHTKSKSKTSKRKVKFANTVSFNEDSD